MRYYFENEAVPEWTLKEENVYVFNNNNKFSARSIKVKLSALLGNYDRQTNRQRTNRPIIQPFCPNMKARLSDFDYY